MAVLVVNLSHIGVAYIGESPITSQDVYAPLGPFWTELWTTKFKSI